MSNYLIRLCSGFEDYEKCIELETRIWGRENGFMPLRLYIICENAGGFTLGVFDSDGNMLAFLNTFPAFEQTKPIYYSHMLAVSPELQNSGLGRQLKFRQREIALERGIDFIKWTFDPLISKNANFNINKLGCVVRQYKTNFYGSGGVGVFDAGLEADRLFAEWHLQSRRVIQVVRSEVELNRSSIAVEIPYDFSLIKKDSLEEAKIWRYRVRDEFLKMFEQGLACTGFEVNRNGHSLYYFSEWNPPEYENR